ncbi:Ribose transport system permease protein RbsC [Planctomycetes bacterium Pan216]|uniref:Ribose transport system permease protein RbsC n=1 Tax=Kolteria novifilia TaxID=2527975 RepID=A0A518BBA0_9BACT|nr:Ribose transport system permease protein RbsC [Planctomycetes bacterium Pan216]
MKKTLGILGLLIVVVAITAMGNPKSFLSPYNLENLTKWTSLFGIISIGVSFVIITGGIDLSIGSVVGLTGCLLAMLVSDWGVPAVLAVPIVLVISLILGLCHGLLIAKLKLQPFIVTLCGLLLYRGISRFMSGDDTQGFGNEHQTLRMLANGKIPIPFTDGFDLPIPAIMLIVLAVVAAIFLNKTIYGRYLLALGRNEQAARYSGINTDVMVILSYVICSMAAGLGGVLFALDLNSVQPASMGEFYELYAIAAAVLGGCSLRGGEGTIFGVLIGTAVIQVLRNSISILGIPSQLNFAIIGSVLLIGVAVDEIVKRMAARRRRTMRVQA